MDIITHLCEPIRFNHTNHLVLNRQGDVIKSLYLKFKMAPLPIGYIYKNCWTRNAVESIDLHVGGQSIWKTTKEKERMLNLILPQDTTTNRDLSFDYNIEERSIKSLYVHETIFELNIKEIFGDRGLPLIALPFHNVDVYITLGSFENCIEPIYNIEEPELDPNINYMIECLPQSIFIYLDSTSRSALSNNSHSCNTKNYNIATNVFTSNQTDISIDQNGVCTSAYIHITNEDGSEIQNQVLDSIKVLLNGSERVAISGFQSRHQMRTLVPHATLDNNISQNLYYISYYSEYPTNPQFDNNFENGFENGLNASRIDSYRLVLSYLDNIPPRIKMSVIHRSQNIFIINNGMGGYRYSWNDSRIMTTDAYRTEQQQQQQQHVQNILNNSNNIIPPAIFLPSEHSINTSDDICIITLEPIIENGDIVKCMQCSKICMMDALNEWFKTSKTCPHCRASHSNVEFICGKAQFNII
jgi:hypothetical protein